MGDINQTKKKLASTIKIAEELHNRFFSICKDNIKIGDDLSFKINFHFVEKCNELRYLRDMLETNML